MPRKISPDARRISHRDDGRMTMMLPARIRGEVAAHMREVAATDKRSLASVVGEIIERGVEPEKAPA